MNLVIGNTSQISKYFPEEYVKISSRNISSEIYNKKWDSVYICFAEQRTYIAKDELFNEVNFKYTSEVIEKIKSDRIVFYSTAELWNNTVGEISLDNKYCYHPSDYVSSKEKITKYILENYKNVIVAYPFNFNSKYRMPPFLFGKIFDSIINKKKIEIGDTYYYREILHPKYVAEESIKMNSHEIIGTGDLIFVNDFIRDLYKSFRMNYEDYVFENLQNLSFYRKNIFYSKRKKNTNRDILIETIIRELKDEISNKIS